MVNRSSTLYFHGASELSQHIEPLQSVDYMSAQSVDDMVNVLLLQIDSTKSQVLAAGELTTEDYTQLAANIKFMENGFSWLERMLINEAA
jgi:hypothetical protein